MSDREYENLMERNKEHSGRKKKNVVFWFAHSEFDVLAEMSNKHLEI